MLVHTALYKKDIPKEDKNVDIPHQSRARLRDSGDRCSALRNADIDQKLGDIRRHAFGRSRTSGDRAAPHAGECCRGPSARRTASGATLRGRRHLQLLTVGVTKGSQFFAAD